MRAFAGTWSTRKKQPPTHSHRVPRPSSYYILLRLPFVPDRGQGQGEGGKPACVSHATPACVVHAAVLKPNQQASSKHMDLRTIFRFSRYEPTSRYTHTTAFLSRCPPSSEPRGEVLLFSPFERRSAAYRKRRKPSSERGVVNQIKRGADVSNPAPAAIFRWKPAPHPFSLGMGRPEEISF